MQIRGVGTALLLLLVALSPALAQSAGTKIGEPSTVITASASGERVRFTAPRSAVQIRLEVYNAEGKRLSDVEVRGGNVLDWLIQDGQAVRLPDGAYLCVVTVKALSGKITQRVGAVAIEKATASVREAAASEFTAQQTAAIGPLEEDAALIVMKEDENRTTTVIAHTGEEGQIIRGRGALSLRLGDFFSGKDKEQMRLTAEGNVGIGTSSPQAKLDVAGQIKSSEGIMFPDGSVQLSASSRTLGAPSLRAGQSQHVQGEDTPLPDISGTGTTGRISKWLDGPNGVLNDSNITEVSGAIGINGTPSTSFRLDVNGSTRIRGSNPGFNLEGLRPAGNIWLFQTVDDDGRFRLFGQDNINPGAERLTISLSTGNVGIGVTSPVSTLDVGGAINASTQYNLAGSRVLSVAGSLNTFVGVSAGTNNTGSDNSFFGRLAGTANTTGDSNSFFGRSAGSSNTTGGNNVFVGRSAGNTNTTGSNNTILGYVASVGTNNLSNATALGARAQVDCSNCLVLGSVGGINGASASPNVGIGTTTPATNLEVVNDGGSAAHVFTTSYGNVHNTIIGRQAGGTLAAPSATANGLSLLSLGGRGHTGAGFVSTSRAGVILAASENWTSTANGARITFDTTANGTTNRVERMRIDHDGNVGIGTTSPATNLEVVNDGGSAAHVFTTSYGNVNNAIVGRQAGGTLATPSATTSGLSLLFLGGRGHTGSGFATTSRAGVNMEASQNWTASATGTRITFDTTENGATGRVERMRIDHNGSVGIGTTTPSSHTKLHVVQTEFIFPGTAAIRGESTASSSTGVEGVADTDSSSIGIHGSSSSGRAGLFNGDVDVFGDVAVVGNLSKASGAFKIDHPLDPANKYLYHSFVESPDMKNIYDGNVTTDDEGEAEIVLPDWFEALNRDFRYQLTVIGQFAQAIVAEKIKGNRFKIRTSLPQVEVSWQVTGIRRDAFAERHRIPVEEVKPERERGFYLHPAVFDEAEEKGVEWARRPEQMKRAKETREGAKLSLTPPRPVNEKP